MQFRPVSAGRGDSFLDRHVKKMDACIVTHLTEHNGSICGSPVCFVFDHEVEKFAFDSEGTEQVGETITVSWLKDEYPNARPHDDVVFNGVKYQIKDGFPIDQRDCWVEAQLYKCARKRKNR